jgi:nicotinate-nucleotide pyrophosphorylase (carboxylating)
MIHISDEKATAQLDAFILQALAEDTGSGDHTSLACIPENSRSNAFLLVKEPGVLAGVEVARRTFGLVAPDAVFTQHIEDGADVSAGEIAFEVQCNTRLLLGVERVILNTMQRMSGIASLSNRFHFEVEDLPVTILDTRKTTPLIRFLEKWAVRLGGCTNYRDGLYDRFLIKDNHVEACGSVRDAIQGVLAYRKANDLEDLGITIEVRNLVELYAAIEVGHIDRIMLDNFELPLLQEAVDIVAGRYETEASGGVNIHNVRKIALTGVNFISVGALTHSAVGLDLSLKIRGH